MGAGFIAIAPQLLEHLVHAGDGVVNGVQHVGLKFRVGLVLFGIRQQQRELGDEVFQVVNDERGGTVERLELARHDELVGRTHLRQVGGRLTRRHLEQIADFPVEADFPQ